MILIDTSMSENSKVQKKIEFYNKKQETENNVSCSESGFVVIKGDHYDSLNDDSKKVVSSIENEVGRVFHVSSEKRNNFESYSDKSLIDYEDVIGDCIKFTNISSSDKSQFHDDYKTCDTLLSGKTNNKAQSHNVFSRGAFNHRAQSFKGIPSGIPNYNSTVNGGYILKPPLSDDGSDCDVSIDIDRRISEYLQFKLGSPVNGQSEDDLYEPPSPVEIRVDNQLKFPNHQVNVDGLFQSLGYGQLVRADQPTSLKVSQKVSLYSENKLKASIKEINPANKTRRDSDLTPQNSVQKGFPKKFINKLDGIVNRQNVSKSVLGTSTLPSSKSELGTATLPSSKSELVTSTLPSSKNALLIRGDNGKDSSVLKDSSHLKDFRATRDMFQSDGKRVIIDTDSIQKRGYTLKQSNHLKKESFNITTEDLPKHVKSGTIQTQFEGKKGLSNLLKMYEIEQSKHQLNGANRIPHEYKIPSNNLAEQNRKHICLMTNNSSTPIFSKVNLEMIKQKYEKGVFSEDESQNQRTNDHGRDKSLTDSLNSYDHRRDKSLTDSLNSYDHRRDKSLTDSLNSYDHRRDKSLTDSLNSYDHRRDKSLTDSLNSYDHGRNKSLTDTASHYAPPKLNLHLDHNESKTESENFYNGPNRLAHSSKNQLNSKTKRLFIIPINDHNNQEQQLNIQKSTNNLHNETWNKIKRYEMKTHLDFEQQNTLKVNICGKGITMKNLGEDEKVSAKRCQMLQNNLPNINKTENVSVDDQKTDFKLKFNQLKRLNKETDKLVHQKNQISASYQPNMQKSEISERQPPSCIYRAPNTHHNINSCQKTDSTPYIEQKDHLVSIQNKKQPQNTFKLKTDLTLSEYIQRMQLRNDSGISNTPPWSGPQSINRINPNFRKSENKKERAIEESLRSMDGGNDECFSNVNNGNSRSPLNAHKQSSKSPSNSHNQSSKSPSNSHNQSSRSPLDVHNQSSKSPLNAHNQSSRSPLDAHNQSSRSPLSAHNQSSRSPLSAHNQSSKSESHNDVQSTESLGLTDSQASESFLIVDKNYERLIRSTDGEDKRDSRNSENIIKKLPKDTNLEENKCSDYVSDNSQKVSHIEDKGHLIKSHTNNTPLSDIQISKSKIEIQPQGTPNDQLECAQNSHLLQNGKLQNTPISQSSNTQNTQISQISHNQNIPHKLSQKDYQSLNPQTSYEITKDIKKHYKTIQLSITKTKYYNNNHKLSSIITFIIKIMDITIKTNKTIESILEFYSCVNYKSKFNYYSLLKNMEYRKFRKIMGMDLIECINQVNTIEGHFFVREFITTTDKVTQNIQETIDDGKSDIKQSDRETDIEEDHDHSSQIDMNLKNNDFFNKDRNVSNRSLVSLNDIFYIKRNDKIRIYEIKLKNNTFILSKVQNKWYLQSAPIIINKNQLVAWKINEMEGIDNIYHILKMVWGSEVIYAMTTDDEAMERLYQNTLTK